MRSMGSEITWKQSIALILTGGALIMSALQGCGVDKTDEDDGQPVPVHAPPTEESQTKAPPSQPQQEKEKKVPQDSAQSAPIQPVPKEPVSKQDEFAGHASTVDGVWATPCFPRKTTEGNFIDQGHSARMELRKGQYLISNRSYSDKECKKPLLTLNWIGTSNITPIDPQQGKGLMTLVLSEIRLEIHSEDEAKKAADRSLCGIQNWHAIPPQENEGRLAPRTDVNLTGIDCKTSIPMLAPARLADPQGTRIDPADTQLALAYSKGEHHTLHTSLPKVIAQGFSDPKAITRPSLESFQVSTQGSGFIYIAN